MTNKATQFDLMMKTIMVVLFMFGLFIFFIDVTKAAELWVSNPALCPVTSTIFSGQSCTPDRICGDNSGIAQCYDTAILVPPFSSTNISNNYAGSGISGYLINCFAIDDGAGARCDNNGAFWCDRNETCYNTNHKETVCTGGVWGASTCGSNCIANYLDCDGNSSICEIQIGSSVPGYSHVLYASSCGTYQCSSGYADCNGDGTGSDGACEIHNGDTCYIGSLQGTIQGCSAGVGNCIIPTSTFVTGVEAKFSTTSPLLWGKQFGSGDLVSFSNATSSNIFVVKNDASVFMSSTLATTTDKYFYNYNGDLYWGDEKLNTGGGVYTAGDGLNLAGYEFTVDTSSNFIWSGQHTFNATTTFPLGVWNADGKVGINTTTLNYALNVQMDVGTYGGFGIYGANGNLLGGFGNEDLTGVNSNGAIGLYYENSDPSQPHSYFTASGHSFLSSSTLAIGSNLGNDGWDSSLMVEGGVHIENGVLRFNGVSGTIDQVLRISSTGFPEWVDIDSLFTNNTTFNSSTEFNSTSTFNSTAIFEGPSYFNNDVFVSGTISSTNLYVNGNSTTTGDLYVLGQAIFHDILPADNLAYTIGTSSLVWKEGWFGKIFTPEIDFTNNWKLSTTTGGGLAFTSSTQVALAILSTGQVGINTTTVEANLKMKVDGNIGSRMYCDINGNNCFNPNEFGWATPQARYMNTTTANYNGNFGSFSAASGTIGYEAANHICSSTVGAGYHICQANEILDIIRLFGTSTFAGKTNGWVANGPPGYVTVSTNDCEGYTTSTVSFYGAWWKFNDSSGGGSGKMTNCSTLQPIACCK